MRDPRFLIIDSNPGNGNQLAGILGELGHPCELIQDPAKLDGNRSLSDFDCVLVDRDSNIGLGANRFRRETDSNSPLFILTGPENSAPPDGRSISSVDGYLPRDRENIQRLMEHVRNAVNLLAVTRLVEPAPAGGPGLYSIPRMGEDFFIDPSITIRTRKISSLGPTEDFALAASCGNNRYSILLGDMTGSDGIKAYAMMHLKSRMASYLMESGDPSRLLGELNNEVIRQGHSIDFITAVAVFVDLDNKRITYSVAGHQTPLYRRWGSRRWNGLPGHGIPLGIRNGEQFQRFDRRMSPGDKILLISDGILKMRGPRGGFRGWDDVIGDMDMFPKDAAPVEIMDSIGELVESVIGGESVSDEITAMLIQL